MFKKALLATSIAAFLGGPALASAAPVYHPSAYQEETFRRPSSKRTGAAALKRASKKRKNKRR